MNETFFRAINAKEYNVTSATYAYFLRIIFDPQSNANDMDF